MQQSNQFRFVTLLALELENGDIVLPSLPDVVTKIRESLASADCDFQRVSQAVSIDPVLVSKLFVYANSALYNRANVEIDTLEGAIGRLGFEVVRNTAMSLAMKQLYRADKKNKTEKYLRAIWARGMKLSSMGFAIARQQGGMNPETAFLCGVMHEVGKLYILTKAEEFPELLGNSRKLAAVMQEWNPQISKSIIESWGFPDDVIESADPDSFVDDDLDAPPALADVMAVARLLVDGKEEMLASAFEENPSCQKLGISEAVAAEIMDTYREKLQSMQQTLSV